MKNKERFKGFVTGLIVATIITSAAFAAGGKTIEVFYDAVKDIKINQVSKMPKGTSAPFVYKGTTFVPLRFISENLGQPVKWDGKTKTVHIGEMADENATYIGNGIDYMNFQYGHYSEFKYNYNSETPIKDNIGNEYVNYLAMYIGSYASSKDGWNYIEFPTNGQYENFKTTLGLTEKYKSTGATFKVQIYADDKLVYEKNMQSGDMPEDINVNIKNAIKTKIKVIKTNNVENCLEVGLFNPKFVK